MSGRPDPVAPPGVAVRTMEPVGHPLQATMRPPGSKSITNRALLVAGLAGGRSVLDGVLDADDTAAMADCVAGLGATVHRGPDSVWEIDGVGGRPHGGPATLDARLSGTTARFILAACALGGGPWVVDGRPPLQARPMGGAITALADLGVGVEAADGGLPVTVTGGPASGGRLTVDGSLSSQFLSGLAMAGACMPDGLDLTITGSLVSRPYVDMTVAVMRQFGAQASIDGDRLRVAPGGYVGSRLAIEPDASAASYFMAAAAVCGGEVRIEGLGAASLQGDTRFASVLERMGAVVTMGPDHITVAGPPDGRLRGVTANLADFSDTAPTLAAVATFADGPTEVTGIGFIRHKETDRIAAVVTELRRLGVGATETPDGFVITPAQPQPAAIRTYDDHRMAMAFAIVGLRAPGVVIVDPGCVDKTYPEFFSDLEAAVRP